MFLLVHWVPKLVPKTNVVFGNGLDVSFNPIFSTETVDAINMLEQQSG
jgi:hypothetical protein